MRLVAGIDVGNATTEVVVADVDATPITPVAWDRAPTRGEKGSLRSLHSALDLLHRIERRDALTIDAIAIAPQHPVHTTGAVVAERPPDTGRLITLSAGSGTPGGAGVAVGRPVPVEADPIVGELPVVLVARDPLGFRDTAVRVNRWIDAGANVAGVLLAGDEAVLVSTRVSSSVPIIDGVDASLALSALLVTLEVAPAGRPARDLTDPVRISALLGLSTDEHGHAEAIARRARGVRDVAIAVLPVVPAAIPTVERPWVRASTAQHFDLTDALRGAIGDITSVALPGRDGELIERPAADLWGVDLSQLADDSALAPHSGLVRSLALATLAPPGDGENDDLVTAVASRDSRAVLLVESEAAAARAGALTTPSAATTATVVDIGAGTIDVIDSRDRGHVLAGAGDLLTVATAELLGISRGQGEWVKRGPCSRIETPHVAVDEDGTRRFLESVAGPGLVGWLTVPGPAGALPFHRNLAPGDWRSLRLRLKRDAIGDNVRRAAPDLTGDVLVVGGPAGDDEVLDCVARALPGTSPGRGNVAGVLGHRWAVAFGLVLLAASTSATGQRGAH